MNKYHHKQGSSQLKYYSLSQSLILFLALTLVCPVQSKGGAPDEGLKAQQILLKGQVTYVVPQGTPIKLKLASVPSSGLRLADRDLDGNLYPAELNEEITAKTTEDLYVDEKKVIPEGTIFHGHVSSIVPPRRVGRPGSLALTFDYFTTPDGKRFAFRAEANNCRASTFKTKAKGLGIIAAHTAGGAITGALVAYQLFGLQNTVALHGYNLAGGAAAGALGATAYALLRRGPKAVLEPGDDLNMEIDSDLLLPAATEPTLKKPAQQVPGLEIEVVKSKMVKDELDGYYLRLEALITNDTNNKLTSMDLFVEDTNGHRFPVATCPDENSELIFHVEPHSMKRVLCAFQVEYPRLKYKLVWINQRTRQEIFSQKLP